MSTRGKKKTDEPLDVIGLREMAPLFGVNERTPNIWRHRSIQGEMGEHPMPDPEPGVEVSGAPVWRRSKIIAWGRATGRPMPGLQAEEHAEVVRETVEV